MVASTAHCFSSLYYCYFFSTSPDDSISCVLFSHKVLSVGGMDKCIFQWKHTMVLGADADLGSRLESSSHVGQGIGSSYEGDKGGINTKY